MVLALTGKGVQKARKAHFDGGKKALPLADLQLEVPVASQYTHLGGVLDHRVEMKPEMRRRLAVATSSYEAGSKLIFANGTIPLNIRTQMFETVVLSTFHNIALWIPEGPAWSSMCGGYTRLLRRLLSTRYKGSRLFDVPAPFVHIATGSWCLELHAAKSRLGTLSAMARNPPAPLWAVLQQEQKWLKVVSKDLEMIKNEYDDLPDLNAADWPRWWHYLRDNVSQFKQRVKKTLQEFPAMAWGCRSCRRSFKSKGCVQGSICAACGRQYWNTERLSTHLRDSAKCVSWLRAQGKVVTEVMPGKGSKAFQKRCAEEFSLAPTQQAHQPNYTDTEEVWVDEQKGAYRAICEGLTGQAHWQSVDDIREFVMGTIAEFPLYYHEEQAVVERLASDAALLWNTEPDGQWDRDTSRLVMDALAEMEQWHQPFVEASHFTVEAECSLGRFMHRTDSID
ncbi:unnamed protein product, partial [Symbiodinium sp. CCMP2456]